MKPPASAQIRMKLRFTLSEIRRRHQLEFLSHAFDSLTHCFVSAVYPALSGSTFRYPQSLVPALARRPYGYGELILSHLLVK